MNYNEKVYNTHKAFDAYQEVMEQWQNDTSNRLLSSKVDLALGEFLGFYSDQYEYEKRMSDALK
jgi:hypothetical protein